FLGLLASVFLSLAGFLFSLLAGFLFGLAGLFLGLLTRFRLGLLAGLFLLGAQEGRGLVGGVGVGGVAHSSRLAHLDGEASEIADSPEDVGEPCFAVEGGADRGHLIARELAPITNARPAERFAEDGARRVV